MLRYFNQFYLYTIIWIIYMMQEMLFGEGGGIGRLLLIVLLVWSILIFIKTTRHSILPRSLNVLAVLLGTYILYGLVPILTSETLNVNDGVAVPPFSYMKSALISIVPVFVFFHYAKKGYITQTNIKWLAVAFFAILIFDYYHSATKLLLQALERGSSREEFTNNVGYNFLCLLPYLYFFKKKYALLFMLGIMAFIVMAMKRGAIMIGAVCVMFYLYQWFRFASRKTKMYAFIGIVCIFVLSGHFIMDFYEQSSYFQKRVEDTLEGYTSNRDVIASSLWGFYVGDASLFEQLFGCGANGTLKHATNYAHNDWLEMLINQGLVGVLIQLAFYVTLFFDMRKMRRIDKQYYYSFLTLYIIVFTKTIFSMSICAMLPYTTMMLGFFLYQIVRSRQVVYK